jgi:phage terminase large subunit-like protein
MDYSQRTLRRFFENKTPKAFVAFDMASRRDLCSMSVAYPRRNITDPELSQVWVESYSWTCRAAIEEKEPANRETWEQWANEGWLTIHPTRAIRLRSVLNDFLDLAKCLRVETVVYDPWNAELFIQDLEDAGFNCEEFRQGYKTMSPAVKMVEASIYEGLLKHDGSPLLRHAMENLKMDQDAAGNLKPNKPKSTAKIDPAVSMIMAGSVALQSIQKVEPTFGVGVW